MSTKANPPIHQIELRVGKLSALFNSIDPSPFRHRDLNPDAREFLEDWALDLPQPSRYRILVQIEEVPAEDPEPIVTEAIHNFFRYQTEQTRRRLKLMMREGRISLLIGVCFLSVCLVGADALNDGSGRFLPRVLSESLVILGWVGLWRPIEMLLYGWWPLVRRWRIYRNLQRAVVRVAASPSAEPHTT